MKVKRKILIFLLITLVSIAIVGCTGESYTSTLSSEELGKTYMEMSYESFSGNRYTEIELKSGDVLQLKVKLETKDGNLDISVIDDDDNCIYSVDTPEKAVEEKNYISKDGKYKIKVEGKHKGSYKVSWNIISQYD